MSNNVRKNFDYLTVLHKTKSPVRKAILKNADKELIKAICECIDNVIRGEVKVPEKDLKKAQENMGL